MYLALFWLLTLSGIPYDMQRPYKHILITGEIFSAIFVSIFVTAYFNSDIGDIIGNYIIVMLIVGFIVELFGAQRAINDNKEDPDLSKKELFYINNICLVLGHLFVVPGYVFGLMVGIQHASL